MKRNCLRCGHLIRGRSDKKFCDDQCRAAYHQTNEKGVESLIRKTNYRLRKNRRILKELNPNGKVKCHRNTLRDKGFDFKTFTSTFQNRDGKVYFFCYEYGYLPLERDYYFLVKQKVYPEVRL